MLVGLEVIGESDDDGVRSVVFRLNGQLRPIDVIDRSVDTATRAAAKADRGKTDSLLRMPANGIGRRI